MQFLCTHIRDFYKRFLQKKKKKILQTDRNVATESEDKKKNFKKIIKVMNGCESLDKPLSFAQASDSRQ